MINTFSVKIVLGEENLETRENIRSIKVRNPNSNTLDININFNNTGGTPFIKKEDIESYTKIKRDTLKKLEEEDKQKIAAEQQKQEEAKKKAEAEAKALEEQKKQEAEDNKPWIEKKLNTLKTFFTPKQTFYNSIKFGVALPQKNNFSASETTTNDISNHLFNGIDSLGLMPFIGISAGFDAERLFRYEVELSYFLFAGSPKNIVNNSIYSNAQFDVTKNVLNFALLNFSLNGFLKLPMPNFGFEFLEKSEFFIGAGIGIGYAFPKSTYLRGALVLPTFQIMSGFTIPINTRFKANIYWKMLYANINFQNQTPFADINGTLANNRAISSGSFELKNFIAQFICFDIMWTY